MAKYGLHPQTLKGELFIILSEQGNNGIKVSDLAWESKVGVFFNTDSNSNVTMLWQMWITSLSLYYGYWKGEHQITILIYLILIFS